MAVAENVITQDHTAVFKGLWVKKKKLNRGLFEKKRHNSRFFFSFSKKRSQYFKNKVAIFIILYEVIQKYICNTLRVKT